MENRINIHKHTKAEFMFRNDDEKFNIVIGLIKSYYHNRFNSEEENLYQVNDKDDFRDLVQMYGVADAVEIAESCPNGYAIAGLDVNYEDIVLIDKENCETIFDRCYAEDLFALLMNFINNQLYDTPTLNRLFPFVDIGKILAEIVSNDKPIIVSIERKLSNGEVVHSIKRNFETLKEAKTFIEDCIEIRKGDIKEYEVLSCNNGYIFINYDMKFRVTYSIEDTSSKNV